MSKLRFTVTQIPELKMLLLSAFGTITIIYITKKSICHLYNTRRAKNLIRKKQQKLNEKKSILQDKHSQINLSAKDIEDIICLNVEELLDSIRSNKYSHTSVLAAYQIKALDMDKELNFIVDINSDAEKNSEDAKQSKGDSLRGIPVSIKDTNSVKGCDCTMGLSRYINKPKEDDNVLVKMIRLQGAVPFVVTNMCQTGMSMESSNPIFGETKNPFDKTRTPGGSSGGEAAILGCGASLLGLGSDIGGSIRIPSHFCGVYGLKPTAARLSGRHCLSIAPKQNLISVSIGPMARNIYDLVYFYKALVGEDLNKLDPNCPFIPFNDVMYKSKTPLRIGYYIHLGENQVQPVPAVTRAVTMAKIALEKAGHTLVEVKIPKIDYAIFEIYLKSLFPDGGTAFINDAIGDDIQDSSLTFMATMLKIPKILKHIIAYLLYPFNRNYSRALQTLAGCNSVYDLWILLAKSEKYREEFLTFLQTNQLDGLLGPVLPLAAPKLGSSSAIYDVVSYTGLYNLLDYPAGSVPVTKVNEEDLKELEKSYPSNTPTHRAIKQDQQGGINLPIGVQCVSYKWREENCLRMMRDIVENI